MRFASWRVFTLSGGADTEMPSCRQNGKARPHIESPARVAGPHWWSKSGGVTSCQSPQVKGAVGPPAYRARRHEPENQARSKQNSLHHLCLLLSCPRHIVLMPPIFQTRRNELKMRQGSMKPSDGKRIAALLRFTSAAAVAVGRNDSSDSRHSASVSANAASSFAKDSGSSDALANRFRSM